LRYTSSSNNAGGTTLAFNLKVFDGSGNLVSDESYSVPVSGTFSDYLQKPIPVISENGNTIISQTTLFLQNGETLTITTVTTKDDEMTFGKRLCLILCIFFFIFYIPGWLVIFGMFCNEYKTPVAKSSVKFSLWFWWQWALLLLAPLAVVVMRTAYKKNKVGQDDKESDQIFHSRYEDRKAYVDNIPKKGDKVVD